MASDLTRLLTERFSVSIFETNDIRNRRRNFFKLLVAHSRSRYRLSVFFALFNLISRPVQVILPRFYLAFSPSLNVLVSPLDLSLSLSRSLARFSLLDVSPRSFLGFTTETMEVLFLSSLFLSLFPSASHSLLQPLRASTLLLPPCLSSRPANSRSLARLSFPLVSTSIFRMTHYRDSKTRAGRIVLVLGKCLCPNAASERE